MEPDKNQIRIAQISAPDQARSDWAGTPQIGCECRRRLLQPATWNRASCLPSRPGELAPASEQRPEVADESGHYADDEDNEQENGQVHFAGKAQIAYLKLLIVHVGKGDSDQNHQGHGQRIKQLGHGGLTRFFCRSLFLAVRFRA